MHCIALSLYLYSTKECCFSFSLFKGPLSLSKEDGQGFCNWREDGEAGEKVKRDILCLNKEVKLTGRVSFRNQKLQLTLKEHQEEVPTLLWTKDGRLSGAVMAAHLQTHTHRPTHILYILTQKHKETLVRGSHCVPLWQYYVWARRTLICLL